MKGGPGDVKEDERLAEDRSHSRIDLVVSNADFHKADYYEGGGDCSMDFHVHRSVYSEPSTDPGNDSLPFIHRPGLRGAFQEVKTIASVLL